MGVDHRSRRGPGIDPALKRDHCVSVRLNSDELTLLDSRRGKFQRGEWMRMATLETLPPSIPALNLEAWRELSHAAANLNQIAKALNQGEKIEPGSLRDKLATFRTALIGAELPREAEGENA